MVWIPGSNNGVDLGSGVAAGMARGNPVILVTSSTGGCGFGTKKHIIHSVKKGTKRSLIKGNVNISNIPSRIKTLEKRNQILKKKPMSVGNQASLASYQILINNKKIKELKEMKRTSGKRTSNKRTSNKRTSNKRTSNKRTSNKRTSGKRISNSFGNTYKIRKAKNGKCYYYTTYPGSHKESRGWFSIKCPY